MVNKIKWMNRKAMVKRGVLMLEAHWRNRCEECDLDRWFERNYGKYSKFYMGSSVIDNRSTIELVFWRDVIRTVERNHNLRS